MSKNLPETKLQLLTIGESGVGKTCLIQRFVNGDFLVNHLATIAIDFKKTSIEINEQKIDLQIWDTAVYSVDDQKSFLAINKWMKQIINNAPKNIKISIVGNKKDLEGDRVIPFEEGKKCADEYGGEFFEVSAFSGDGVNEVFEGLAKRILKDFEQIDHGVKLSKLGKKKRKCC